MVSNKLLTAFFFAPLGQGLFRCNLCGNSRKQVPGSGYSNLLAHLAGKHEGFEAQYADQASSSASLQSYGFVSEETSHMFQWIHWVIMRNMPVHEVEDDLTRAMSKFRPVTARAVKKCMVGIAIKVGHMLEKELGTLFGLMFDGWSHADDGTQTADAHVMLFEKIPDVYEKTKDMVEFLVGDNCRTNQLLSTKMGVPLVRFASHRFNLAVNKYLELHVDLLSEVNNLMVELRHEENLAELKKYTDLCPVKRNAARWSSTYTMVGRYIRIRSEIKKVDAVEEMIPTGAKHRKLVALFEHPKKFE